MTFEDLARKAIRQEALVITNYEDDGTTDDYGDPGFSSTTTDAKGLFRQPGGDPLRQDQGGGVELDVDAEVWVSNEHASLVNTTESDDPKASRITRTRTGQVFIVRDVWDENNGTLRVFVAKQSD